MAGYRPWTLTFLVHTPAEQLSKAKPYTMPAVVNPSASTTLRGGHEGSRPRISQPLEYSGSLDSYSRSDLTPVIGREYRGLQVADVLKSENRGRLIRDLAVTSMQFFFFL